MLKVMLRDPQASYELALNLLKSDISYEKRREAIRLLEAASMRKHAAASYCLGLLLLEKDSPFCDYENGLKSLLLAREQGESRASLALAQFYVPVVDCEGDVVPISHDVFLDLDKLEMSIYLQGRCAVVGDDTFPSVRLCNYIDWKPDATLKQSCLLAHRYYASIDETNLIAQFGLGMCELVIKRQIEGVPNMTALDRFTAAANGGVCAAHKLCWYILEPAVEQDARLFDKYIYHLWWLANRNDGGAVEALSMALKKRSEASGRQITDESGRDQWYWFERGGVAWHSELQA